MRRIKKNCKSCTQSMHSLPIVSDTSNWISYLIKSMKKRMQKRVFKGIVLLICSVMMTGCWDAEDIQNKNILTAVIVDYLDNKYFFYVEVPNLKGKSGGQREKVSTSILKASGKNFIEVRDDLDRRADHPLFLGATRVIFLTDRIAEMGIQEYINRVRGALDYRKTIDIVTTSSAPENILEITPENDTSVGFSVEDTIKSIDDEGTGVHVTVGSLMQAIAIKKVGFIISHMEIKNKENSFMGYSVFKDSKKVGFIKAEERKGLSYLLAAKPQFLYQIEYNGDRIIINARMMKRKIKPIKENNKLSFEISMEISGGIKYIEKQTSLKKKDIDNLKALLEKRIKKDISEAIEQSQKEFKSDYLDFYKYFRIKYPKDFKEMNWNQEYSKAAIELEITANIKAEGMIEVNPKK